MPSPLRAKSGAERQAAFAERRRKKSPLQRDLHRAAVAIYVDDELELLEHIRKLRERILTDCFRLNRRLRGRLLAECMSPDVSTDQKELNQRVLQLLQRHTYLVLPEY